MGRPARDVVNMTEEGGVENNGRGRTLKCMTLNAQSLRYKMEECRKNASDYKTSIVSVTALWGQDHLGMRYLIWRASTCIETIGREGLEVVDGRLGQGSQSQSVHAPTGTQVRARPISLHGVL